MASPSSAPEAAESSAPSTTGLELRTGNVFIAEAVELLSSMRFAISALVVVCIASAIGTIVGQNAPSINYVNQFGAFWAEVFSALDVVRVYNAPWFLVIMGLMLVSTSLCLIRNTPKMLKDARSWRDQVRDSTFPAFKHRTSVTMAESDVQDRLARISALLTARGY